MKKKLFFISIFFLAICIQQSFAQQRKIDSLLTILKNTKEDTNKVNLLNTISIEFQNIYDLHKADSFAKSALTIAVKINFKKGIANSYTYIGDIYYTKSDFENALINYFKSLEFRKMIKDKKAIATSYHRIAGVYDEQYKYEDALKYNFIALKLRTEINDNKGIGYSLGNIGIIYFKQGKYPEALNYFFQTLKIVEKFGDKGDIAYSYNNIASVYETQNYHTDALKYYFLCVKFLETLSVPNKEAIATVYNTIGSIYEKQCKYDDALKIYSSALKLGKEIENDPIIAQTLNNIGVILRDEHKYKEAIEYYIEALTKYKILKDDFGISACLINIGDLNIYLKKLNIAKKYLNEGISLAQKKGFKEWVRNGYNDLSNIDTTQRNWEAAFRHFNLYIVYRDSLLMELNSKRVDSLMLNFEFEKKEALTKLNNEKKIALAVQKRKNERNWWIFGVGLLVGLSFLIFIIYRKRKNYRFKQQISEVRQEALNAQMSDHFIGNTMDSINSFLDNNEKEKASEYLLLFNRLIRQVLVNSFKKSILLNEELEVLKNYIELEKLRFTESNLEYEICIDKDIDTATTLIPPMIFQVLTENSIKHGLTKVKGGKIIVKVEKKKNTIECMVEDNGIGRKASILSKTIEQKEKVSYGSSLAEKLIKINEIALRKTSFKIIDLLDSGNNPIGTRVEFILPLISLN